MDSKFMLLYIEAATFNIDRVSPRYLTMLHYAFQDHKNLLSMGLNKLDLDDWLIEDHLLAEQVALKRSLYEAKSNQVYQALPCSIPAQRELAQALALYLPKKYPNLYGAIKEGVYCKFNGTELAFTGDENTLLRSSWAVQEDLCLLELSDNEDYCLTAASLCAPSYWRLLEKMGGSLDAIHGPIPDYADKLGANVNRFFQKLKVGHPVWRGNWSVVTSSTLYQPGDIEAVGVSDPELIPERCFLRSERQTLQRLPETGAIAFTIKVTVEPISVLLTQPQALQSLQQALFAMSEAEKSYKSIHLLEPALSNWLERSIVSIN